MKSNLSKPLFKKKIEIKGPCLFLVGPIGTFFARLLKYLDNKNVKTYKVLFPLHEFGFNESKLIRFSGEIKDFKEFLRKIIIEKKIKHIFMYGNVLIPHRQAIELVETFRSAGTEIHSHIFELGYFRPNFVTIEGKGVNYKSDFILGKEFFDKQIPYEILPEASSKGMRFRKIWKGITFVNHSFRKYKIVDFDHKLQPKPIYLWFQIKGFLLNHLFRITEYKLKKKLMSSIPFFIVILQVSSDSQLTQGSNFEDNSGFIYKVIKDFAAAKLENINLIFKHHPRDRGYENYSRDIKSFAKEFNLTDKVFYIHDYFLSKLFQNSKCKGTILINSTVGYQSLFHSIPVKALGIAPYNIEGLTYQNDLISFFRNPHVVDNLLFRKFYKYILENSQINGNFDGFFPFEKVFVFESYD